MNFQMEVKCVRIVLVSFCRRRAAAKRKKLKLVSGAGGGDGEVPPEEEEDPEEDSSLAGTGQDLEVPRIVSRLRWREEQPSIEEGGRSGRIPGRC